MSKKLQLDGKVAVVTGAASGIGRAIARSLARRGCHLAIADINETGLEETARLIGNSVRVTRHLLDVSDGKAIADFPAIVKAAHGGVDVLVNNAGVALGGTFAQLTEEEFDWLIDINFFGVVRMSRAFMPLLEEHDAAQLVNLSSLFGLIAPPGQTAYSAAKFAVRGFSESLRNELIAAESTVGVTVVHPGGVKTAIARNARMAKSVPPCQVAGQQARMNKVLTMPPEQAGEIIVQAIEQRLPRVLVGNDAKMMSVVERIMPVRYWQMLSKWV